MTLLARIAVTSAVIAGLVAARRVPLPGLDGDVLADAGVDPAGYSVVALGPMTWASAFLLVELGCLLRAPWRALRVGGPAARARLEQASRLAWAVVCAAQGFGLAVSLESALGPFGVPPVAQPGTAFRLLTLATLAAGSALFALAARVIEARGVGNGFAVLTGLVLAERSIVDLQLAALFEEAYRPAFAPVVLVLVGVAVAAGRLPRWWTRDGTLPLLSAGLVPVAWAMGAAQIAGILGATLPEGGEPLLVAALATVATLLLSTLFHAPWNVAPVVGQPQADVSAALRRTWPVALACVGAHAWDLVEEMRARRAWGGIEVAWPLHRAYALPPALRALATVGIPATARGLRFRLLVHFFGPYVPIEILVPPGRAEEARRVLGALPGFATR